MDMKDMKFCQSCAMPMPKGVDNYGTEADGSMSEDYCNYCYQDGKFLQECTMQEMLDFSIKPMVDSSPDMTEEQARAMLDEFFPKLKRWSN